MKVDIRKQIKMDSSDVAVFRQKFVNAIGCHTGCSTPLMYQIYGEIICADKWNNPADEKFKSATVEDFGSHYSNGKADIPLWSRMGYPDNNAYDATDEDIQAMSNILNYEHPDDLYRGNLGQ